MEINKFKAVSFTGHRPEKLPDNGRASSDKIKILKSMLYAEISAAVDEGYDTFLTGMQRGIDLWAGEAVMSLASTRDIHLAAVLPYRRMGDSFKGNDKWVFGRIMDFAEKIVIISEEYTPSCLAERNRFLVDNSARLIAVIGEERSGTGQTVRYAGKQGIEVRTIDIRRVFPDEDGQLTLL